MVAGADAAGGEIHFAGLRFGERNQFLHRFGRHVRIDDQQIRRFGEQRDRCEVAQRFIGQFQIEAGVDRHRADGGLHQRVAVGHRAFGDFTGDVAGGAAAVVDDHLLSEGFAEFLREQAADDVAGAAGREGQHQADRAFGVGGRADGRHGGSCDEDGEAGEAGDHVHGVLPGIAAGLGRRRL